MTEFAWPGTGAGNLAQVVSTENWANSLGNLVAPGIIDDGTYTDPGKPFGDGSGAWAKLNPFRGTVRAFFYEETSTQQVPIAANAASQARIDLLVLRLNLATQILRPTAILGTPGATPAAPNAVWGVGDIWDVPLGTVRVEAGAFTVGNAIQTVTSDKVADAREFSLNPLTAPRGVLGYAQIVAESSAVGTLTAVTGLSKTLSVGTGRRIRVSCSGLLTSSSDGAFARLDIQQDGSIVETTGIVVCSTDAIAQFRRAAASVILTPTAGSHTYTVALEPRDSPAHLVAVKGAATDPAWLLIEDIGV